MDAVALTKVITWFAYPLGFATLLLFTSFVLKIFRRSALSRFASLSACLILLISSNPMFAQWLAHSLESKYPQLETWAYEKHQGIIVLGGGLGLPLRPSTRPQLGAAGDRYWYAAQLYSAGRADMILLSGGNVFQQNDHLGRPLAGEATHAAAILLQWGVAKQDIVIEAHSRTTEQNKAFIETRLAQTDIESVLLVTSALHMPRSMMHFSDLPIKITPAPADFRAVESRSPAIFKWIPSANALALSTQALHEYYGMAALSVFKAL